jgi:hypothetical protein
VDTDPMQCIYNVRENTLKSLADILDEMSALVMEDYKSPKLDALNATSGTLRAAITHLDALIEVMKEGRI